MGTAAKLEAVQIKFFVWGVNLVIQPAESDQQAVEAKLILKFWDDGQCGTFSHEDWICARRFFDCMFGGSDETALS